ncbi:DUF1800 domain-containing protein [Primorskyibacter sp. 2E233]|uniref:DUF1800 domain-containing protein n=1 Tax=Primorskyibacter sp. 2E233 TaxID=3413431 RepID=UPI003BF0DD59
MTFEPIIADIRFGCGLAPHIAAPSSLQAILDGLTEPDRMSIRFPIPSYAKFRDRLKIRAELQGQLKASRGTDQAADVRENIRLMNAEAYRDQLQWLAVHLVRRSHSETPFLERLEGFWADHFTAAGKGGLIRRAASPYTESAIRPKMAGRFEDLLISAVTHPLMLHYLDQQQSVGPNSVRGKKAPGKFGLNENLAREVMELHTLGVDGPYTQDDVTQMAALLTGLKSNNKTGRKFLLGQAEPGLKVVLGKTYGHDAPSFGDIEAVLRDLARHPATARHLARKLAVHFVSDAPDPDLVRAIAAAWIDSDGLLTHVYEALLSHPAAWTETAVNVKRPFDFVASACRALAVSAPTLLQMEDKDMRRRFLGPLSLMGHVWQQPNGPDGLEEADSAWITPQGIAARLQWAMAVPQMLVSQLPDPRQFVETALGPKVPERVRFAAAAAESRSDGIGLVLASPAFQRM